MNTESKEPDSNENGESAPKRRRTRRGPCPHCGARIPVKEHRCTHCGQDIIRHFWPSVWAGLFFLGFLFFCAALYVAMLWLRR